MSLMAQSGHRCVHRTCPLLGVKQTWPLRHMSAFAGAIGGKADMHVAFMLHGDAVNGWEVRENKGTNCNTRDMKTERLERETTEKLAFWRRTNRSDLGGSLPCQSHDGKPFFTVEPSWMSPNVGLPPIVRCAKPRPLPSLRRIQQTRAHLSGVSGAFRAAEQSWVAA
jgi:hypothetical protein